MREVQHVTWPRTGEQADRRTVPLLDAEMLSQVALARAATLSNERARGGLGRRGRGGGSHTLPQRTAKQNF